MSICGALLDTAVVMDSGLDAAHRPGMTDSFLIADATSPLVAVTLPNAVPPYSFWSAISKMKYGPSHPSCAKQNYGERSTGCGRIQHRFSMNGPPAST